MEGLKPMADKAMSESDMALHDAKAMGAVIVTTCAHCGKWIEEGNTGTVCGACAQSLLGMNVVNPNDYGASNLTPASQVGITVNGRNLTVTAYRTLQGWADDIANSLLPEEIRLLVSLLAALPPVTHKPLPPEFWEAIEANQKIKAIKELRNASTLDLKSSKDIVDAIMSKPEPEDKDKSEDGDKGDSEDSEPGDTEDGEPSGDVAEDTTEAGSEAPAEAAEGQEADGNGQDAADTATADAIAGLAQRAHDNGKHHSEDEIRAALKTLGIQF